MDLWIYQRRYRVLRRKKTASLMVTLAISLGKKIQPNKNKTPHPRKKNRKQT
jgi:hypothetical protein